MKIVRNESIGNYSWDYTTSGGYTNEWKTAQLNMLLNSGAYYNRTTGSYYNGSISATNVNFSSTGLNDIAKKMIKEAKWYLGGIGNYSSSLNGLVLHFYKNERGTDVYSGRSTSWTGKVGLIYSSDYGFATSGGSVTDRNSCMSKEIYNWDSTSYSDCKNNNWLFKSTTYWLLSPDSSGSSNVFVSSRSGFVYYNGANLTYGIFPTVYLKSSVRITSGTGSSADPFILNNNL